MIGNKTQLKKLLVMLEDVIDNMDHVHTEEIFGDYIEGLDRFNDKAFFFPTRTKAGVAEEFGKALNELQRGIYRVIHLAAPVTFINLKFEDDMSQLISEFKAQEAREEKSGSEHPAEESEPALVQSA